MTCNLKKLVHNVSPMAQAQSLHAELRYSLNMTWTVCSKSSALPIRRVLIARTFGVKVLSKIGEGPQIDP